MDFMHRALDLAEEVAGGLAPRPPVGAVIVAADGKSIVGEGATQPNPGPHAEAVAITNAGDDTQGATIYCTLEPHQNHSTTPPCSQAIIDAGIKRVICPSIDPNPQVAGRGFEHLRAAGIEVTNDVDDTSAQRANDLIEGFAKHIKTGLPFVTAKWAMSLDGKIATRTGDSKWITGPQARAHAHQLRYRSDAIITGIGTVLADNPRLTARDPNTGKRRSNRPYIRVIVDSQARMPKQRRPFERRWRSDTSRCTRNHFPPLRGGMSEGKGTPPSPSRSLHSPPPAQGEIQRSAQGMPAGPTHHILTLPNSDNKTVDLTALIHHLGERGCHNVLIEAGEKLTGELFNLKLVDKVVTYMATDKIIGGQTAPSPHRRHRPRNHGKTFPHLSQTRIERLGDDIAIIGYVDYPQETD